MNQVLDIGSVKGVTWNRVMIHSHAWRKRRP
jgi:hypothetical protein